MRPPQNPTLTQQNTTTCPPPAPAPLQYRLGFENPVDDYSAFATGIVQITRALHCVPYRDMKEYDEDYDKVNLFFLKLYHGKWHRK